MKDIKEPLIILVVFFLLLGFAYNPLKNAMITKGEIRGDSISSIGTTEKTPAYNSNKETSASQNLKETESTIKQLGQSLDSAKAESKRSPYSNKIRMSNVVGLNNTNPDMEYISLSTSLDKNETVKITGWYLKSEVTGYGVVIGGASLLPFPFNKKEDDIILQRNDRVYLTKGFSPVGISFRTNKCTGYFEENRTFIPSLAIQCPLPKNENLPNFSNNYDSNEACLDVIDRIPKCSTRDSAFLRDLPDTVPSSCKTYITAKVNYNTCVSNHFSDTDFPGNEYRVYFNKFGPLWRERSDKITLYDSNNLVVDSVSY
jgi:hypothetical protein